ncbi:hypothetical protein [Nannocystis pusilla]|uniref:hypothetical protein n=1 Tax=Nannocystis pusilla TaxID=889268 RepID=UPI003DA27691
MSIGTGESGHVPRAMSWRTGAGERSGDSRRGLTVRVDGSRPRRFNLSFEAAFYSA